MRNCLAAGVLLCVVAALAGAGAAWAADPATGRVPAPVRSTAVLADPCNKVHKTNKHGKQTGPKACRLAPEAPSALVYPAAGFVALGAFLLYRRRRGTLSPAG